MDLGIGSSKAKREGKIPWSQTTEFISLVFPPNSGGRAAAFPNFPFLLASGLHIEPFSGDKSKVTAPVPSNTDFFSLNEFGDAKVSIDYETPAYNPLETQDDDPTTLLSHRWTIGGEFLTLEHKGLRWCDGGPVDETITAGLLIPTIEHQITWPRVQNPPFSVMRDRIGTVNDNIMTFNTGDIYTETLLFLGAELHRDIKTDGSLAWEVTYRFSEKRVRPAISTAPTITTPAQCALWGGTWTGTACINIPAPVGVDGTTTNPCGNPATDEACLAAGGTLEPYNCSTDEFPLICYRCVNPAGGWNHFYRSDDFHTGFYRLLTKGRAGPPAINPQPIYQLRSFAELFVEGI